MRAFIATLAFSAYAGLSTAYDLSSCPSTPVGSSAAPGILAIGSPTKGIDLQAGQPFNITWTESSGITDVSLVLCKGPSDNCVAKTCITPSITNTGSYSYTPDTSLPQSEGGGYGILIFDIGKNPVQYQYSPQFGILNSGSPSSSSSSSVASSSASPVAQIPDGQVQASTGSNKPTPSLPKYTPSGSVGTGLYYVPAPTGKVSNTTHSSGFKFSYGPNTAPAGAPINSTQFLHFTPGVNPAPTGALPVTSVAFATATPNGPLAPSVAPTGTSVLTSPSNAAGQVIAGGLVAGLGAFAALVI